MFVMLTLTACQTTKLSVADKKTICAILDETRVYLTREEYELLKANRGLIDQIKKNPAVRKRLNCDV